MLGICDDCGDVSGSVRSHACPRALELENRKVLVSVCAGCYRQRIDSVLDARKR